jgi:FkbH-like protein
MSLMPWLPIPGEAEKGLLKEAMTDRLAPDLNLLRNLASYSWSETELRRIGKSLRVFLAGEQGRTEALMAGLVVSKILVISSKTFSHMADALVGSGLRHGVVLLPDVVEYEDVSSWLSSFQSDVTYDFVFLAQDASSLRLGSEIGEAKAGSHSGDESTTQIRSLLSRLMETIAPKVIVQTIVEDINHPASNIDIAIPQSHRRRVLDYNAHLSAAAMEAGALVYDVASLAQFIGLSNWWPGRMQHLAKLPFAMAMVPLYLDGICRIAGAIGGKSRRVLVLDLDNTLWGGVIGDDGLEGIILGQGDALGEAHSAVQRYALGLKKRGVVLCVASKNTHDVAMEAFRSHPDMLLREPDISLSRINWRDKAANIEELAVALNLGLESFVFLDDNPAERKRVREALPLVAVPELPADPSDWPLILSSAAYFEQTAVTDEDLSRSDYYIADAKRNDARSSAVDEQSFLNSMKMELSVANFDAVGRKRIAQLIAKSNQFNLTTRRYSEADVKSLEENPDYICLQARLKDIFGDNGMISVVIAKVDGNVVIIELWIMSCRVIGRKVEEALLSILAEKAQSVGADTIHGIYRPTNKNALVAEHYSKLGFEKVLAKDDGESHWQLKLPHATRETLPFARIVVG